jgi:hypothetical protein
VAQTAGEDAGETTYEQRVTLFVKERLPLLEEPELKRARSTPAQREAAERAARALRGCGVAPGMWRRAFRAAPGRGDLWEEGGAGAARSEWWDPSSGWRADAQ